MLRRGRWCGRQSAASQPRGESLPRRVGVSGIPRRRGRRRRGGSRTGARMRSRMQNPTGGPCPALMRSITRRCRRISYRPWVADEKDSSRSEGARASQPCALSSQQPT